LDLKSSTIGTFGCFSFGGNFFDSTLATQYNNTMKRKLIQAYMDVAHRFAELSSARRLHVGAIVVKDDRIISIGYNGMPAGWDNNCEDKDFMSGDAGGWLDPDEIEERWPFVATSDEDGTYIGRYRLKTKPEVLHAESNAISKLARSTESGDGASMFITHGPCLDCAKLIYQSGIKEVFYASSYRSNDGIDFLKKCEVKVKQIEETDE
jgi:dCMP deaminase